MGTSKRDTVLTVRKPNGKRVFQHGRSQYRKIDPCAARNGAHVRVYRRGRLIDTGRVERRRMHDGSNWYFTGLEKVIPRWGRIYFPSASPPGYDGCIWDLLPKRFEPGDVIRISTSPGRFRAYMRHTRAYG